MGLEAGFARELFAEWAGDPNCSVIFSGAGSDMSAMSAIIN